MDPIVARFVSETLPVVAGAALTWGLPGAVLGVVLGVLLFRHLDRRGWWVVPGRLAGFVRVLSLLVCVSTGMIGLGVGTGALGVRLGAEDAIRRSHVGTEALPAYGKLSADLVALFTWWADDLADPARPLPDVASAVEPLKAFRESGAEIPVAQVHAAMATVAAALRGPQADAVSNRILEGLQRGVPPEMAQGLNQGLVQVIDAVRSGHKPLPIVQLAWASSKLPEAAAESGDKAALSRDELGRLAAEHVMIPVAMQPFGLILAAFVVVFGVALLALDVGYVLLLVLVRRIFASRKVAD